MAKQRAEKLHKAGKVVVRDLPGCLVGTGDSCHCQRGAVTLITSGLALEVICYQAAVHRSHHIWVPPSSQGDAQQSHGCAGAARAPVHSGCPFWDGGKRWPKYHDKYGSSKCGTQGEAGQAGA